MKQRGRDEDIPMRHGATVATLLLGLAVGWNFTNVAAIADPLSDYYATPLPVIGVFTTVFWLTHAAMQLPSGRSADRFGPRPVAVVALGIAVAGNALALVAPEPAAAIAGRALTGVGTGLAFVAGSDYIRLGRGGALAQGLFGGSAMAGGALALALVPILEDELSWRAPFWSALALSAIGALAVAAGPSRRSAGLHRDSGRLTGLVADRALLRLSAVHMASLGMYTVLFTWIVTLLERARDYSNEAAGAATSVALAAGIVARPFGGWCVRRWPASTRSVLAASLSGGALSTVLLLVAGAVPLTLLATAMMGFSAGVAFAPVFVEAARLRPDAPAAAVGWVNTLGNIVPMAGVPLLGLAFSLPGDGRIGFVVGACLWAAPLILLRRSRRDAAV